MSSGGESTSHHLDASGGREVVYCHQCQHEWYRDNGGLVCPECDGEATEIVTPENDPREVGVDISALAHLHRHHGRDSDDDPDEEDIDDHIMDGHPFLFGQRAIFRDPERPGDGNRTRSDPRDVGQILNSFQTLLESVGGGPRASVGRSGPEQLFPPQNETGSPGRVQYTRFSGPGFGANVTTFTISSNGGGTHTTVRSSSSPMGAMAGGMNPNDPFQSVLGNILGSLGPPRVGGHDPNDPNAPNAPNIAGAPAHDNEPLQPLGLLLQNLMSQFMNPNGVHGDGVYTQQALDQIITHLMEENPQSNAPPPASEETIAKLPRKKLDDQMLGGESKGECTICIDDMQLGDEALVLPCKHWFHEECAVLWLKEHNTCPICRAPIEGDAAGQVGGAQAAPAAAESSSSAQSSSASMQRPEAERRRSNLRQRGSERLASIRDEASSSGLNWRSASSRRTSDSPPHSNTQPASRRVRDPSPSAHRSSRSDASSDTGSGGIFSRIRNTFRGDRQS
ncbi:hypothetical protein TruAng_004573 [Truncatella angustata]|nr:hypothetical protein TruAng_004573 [Truncatella angustata]